MFPRSSLPVYWRNAHALKTGFHEALSESSSSASASSTSNTINSSYYICHICQEIAREPVVFICCGHWMCAYCFLTYTENTKQNTEEQGEDKIRCPNCMKTISPKTSTSPNPPIKRLIEYWDLQVICSFGCGERATIKEMRIHEKYSCSFRPLKCLYQHCGKVMQWIDMIAHLHLCNERTIFCPNCMIPTKCIDFPEHNCIQQLLHLVGKLHVKLLDANISLDEDMNIGPGGAPVYVLDEENENENPMEKYCHKYSQKYNIMINADSDNDRDLPPPPSPFALQQACEQRKRNFLSTLSIHKKVGRFLPFSNTTGWLSKRNITPNPASTPPSSLTRPPHYSRQNAIEDDEHWSTTASLNSSSRNSDPQQDEDFGDFQFSI